ncbi:MAG: SO2930 family diheme c-type cytochrome [Bacteroidota bacterium]
MKNALLLLCVGGFLFFFSTAFSGEEENYKLNLSEYGFFEGELSELIPADGVFSYEINAPLFSDYAHKARFIYLPEGTAMSYQNERVFDFPVGAAILKTFYYHQDERKADSPKRLMETRVLLHKKEGWIALPYIWNEEQTDAVLEVAGGSEMIKWKNDKGKKQQLEYQVPNMVQCKGCHSYDKQLTPIGPSARQLNMGSQLTELAAKGLVVNLPDANEIPQLAQWEHRETGTVAERARAYLDGNCGHCHNPKGPASTSGMFLTTHFDDPTALGINKAPIAAGRGGGGRAYGIVPGKPDQSILVYRMESEDPGEMMPELGRQLIHDQGVALIREWIEEMR